MSGSRSCPQCETQYGPDVRFCPSDGATLRAPASDLVGEVVADRYRVLSKLGEGGMGQVYLAEHVRMKRKSAVKVMSPKLAHDAEAVARFTREAENASQIVHPNVAAIYDFGETSAGLIYLAMEYVEGEPLSALLRREGALTPARTAVLVRQVADGLTAAHDIGIVHRDLKPDNIMIGRGRDGAECAKVVDFGIAKAVCSDDQNVTRAGLSIGTPEYMSPEQIAGDRLDGRSDLYALALVAFHMLTGDIPFPRGTSRETLIARLTERPRSLAEIQPAVRWPAALQAVFDRGLAGRASDRYPFVGELAAALSGAIVGMDASAAPASGPAARVASSAGGASISDASTAIISSGRTRATVPRPEPRARTRVITLPDESPSAERGDADLNAAMAEAYGRRPRRRVFIGIALVLAMVLVGAGATLWRGGARGGNRRVPVPVRTLAAPAKRPPEAMPRSSRGTRTDVGRPSQRRTTSDTRRVESPIEQPEHVTTPVAAEPASTEAHGAASAAATGSRPDSVQALMTTQSQTGVPDDALATTRGDIEIATQRAQGGDYVGANEAWRAAGEQVAVLSTTYPNAPEVAALRKQVVHGMLLTQGACQTARRIATVRGQEKPRCR